jgi:hypothetical protein
MKALIFFLIINTSSFAQTCENSINYSISHGQANIEWSDFKAETVRITLPNDQRLVIPTLGETQLNMEVLVGGSYFIEFINDKKTINTITIEI